MNNVIATQQLLELTMNAMQLGVAILDRHGRILLWNEWLERHSGIPALQALGETIPGLFPALRDSRFADAIAYAGKNRLPSILSPALHRSPLPLFLSKSDEMENHRIQQLIHIIPLAADNQEPCILIQISDVTTSINRENQLRKLAADLERVNYLDSVTGIGNRRQFDKSLSEELRRAHRNASSVALLMIDIDHFKPYNDTYGHPEGDRCLARIAGTLQSALKRAGDVAARYGGEEFVIILPGMTEAEATHFAEELRQHVLQLDIPHQHSLVTPQVTISIGVAVATPECSVFDPDAMLSFADTALYEAKAQGRNRVMLFSCTEGKVVPCQPPA